MGKLTLRLLANATRLMQHHSVWRKSFEAEATAEDTTFQYVASFLSVW